MDIFPISSSLLCPDALREHVDACYSIGEIRDCVFVNSGCTETYRVEAEFARYYFRVYRHGWKSREEVLSEIDILDHLVREKVPAAAPVRRSDGEALNVLHAPEGERYAVLFETALGAPPLERTPALGRALGRVAAGMHDALDTLPGSHCRARMNTPALLHEPLALLRDRYLRGPELEFFSESSRKIEARLAELQPEGLDFGLCHGDFQTRNIHVHSSDQVTVIDFDACLYAWRALDLALLRYEVLRVERDAENSLRYWDAFLEEYVRLRPLEDATVESIPCFVAALQVWGLGRMVQGSSTWGDGILSEHFLSSRREMLATWIEQSGL